MENVSYYNYFTLLRLFALLRSLGMSAVSGISLDIVLLPRKSKKSAFTLNPSSSGGENGTSSWARPKQVAISIVAVDRVERYKGKVVTAREMDDAERRRYKREVKR